jgi:D-aspartate ligase
MGDDAGTTLLVARSTRRRTRPEKRAFRERRHSPLSRPLALVMGDIDMVSALGVGGIQSALFDCTPSAARFSRHVRCVLPWHNAAEHPTKVVQTLLAFARTQPAQPVLFPQTDEALLLVSRHRGELGSGFRFALPPADMVEKLVDKGRFQALAEQHGLPIPHAHRLRPGRDQHPRQLALRYPLVIKPVVRRDAWELMAGGNKAFHAAGQADLAVIWSRLIDCDQEILAQEVVDGPETSIESFHAYVDANGELAGSFTGRKIRTYPERYGHSTSVEVTWLPDVARLGCEILERIDFRGVVKVDFKRDAKGALHLLEINPRFNLWHLPGAIAGVNLPALVYADLTEAPRPAMGPARSGVTWCRPMRDVRAAYVTGTSPLRWLRWARSCDAVSGLSHDDPWPFLLGVFPATTRNQLMRGLGAAFRRHGPHAT